MRKLRLSEDDLRLIDVARSMVEEKEVSGGVVKEVGSALLTREGRMFTGVSLDLACGIGFCAEHSAVADMISHSNDTEIKVIVAHNGSKVIPPCGRCRELMQLVNVKNRDNTDVITSEGEKMKLKYLLPFQWKE